MTSFLKRLAASKEGATMVEYGLMVALIGAALAMGVALLGTTIGDILTTVSTSINAG